MKIEGFTGKFGETVSKVPVAKAADTPKVQSSSPVRSRPVSSFKIKDTYSQMLHEQPVVVREQQEEKHEKIVAREAINEAKVMAAFERYIIEYKPEQMVVIALKSHQPLVQGEQITILVDNQLQIDKVEGIKMHFHHSLMKFLNNGFIALNFDLFDVGVTTEAKRYYTSSEKFEHFVELNPVVNDLKQLFGLELD